VVRIEWDVDEAEGAVGAGGGFAVEAADGISDFDGSAGDR